MGMNKQEKKQLKKIYKEAYARAYKQEKASSLTKEIARINKKAREDAKKDLQKHLRYDPKAKKTSNLGKKAKSMEKAYKKRAKRIQSASDELASNLMGW